MSLFVETLDISNDFQLQRLLEYLPNVTKTEVKPFCVISLRELNGADVRIGGVNLLNFTALRALVRYIVRNRHISCKTDELKRFLGSLNMKTGCAEEIFACVKDTLSSSEEISLKNHRLLTGLHWKIDISLSSKAHTTILLYITTENGAVKAVRLTLHSFHVLRHAVAEVLHGMLRMEERRCMKR